MCHSDSTPTLVDIRPRPRRWPAIVASALAFALATALLVGQGTSIRAARDCREVCRETGAVIIESCAGASAVCSAKAEDDLSRSHECTNLASCIPMALQPQVGGLVWRDISPTAPTHKAAHRRQPKPTPPTDPVEDADHEADPLKLRIDDF